MGLGETFDAFIYYSRYSKEVNIPDEIRYNALNVKYLTGIGAVTYGFAEMNFSNLSEAGMHGVIYMGAGSFENKVWMSATNPYNPEFSEWEYIAKENLGFVFFMDLGGIYKKNISMPVVN